GPPGEALPVPGLIRAVWSSADASHHRVDQHQRGDRQQQYGEHAPQHVPGDPGRQPLAVPGTEDRRRDEGADDRPVQRVHGARPQTERGEAVDGEDDQAGAHGHAHAQAEHAGQRGDGEEAAADPEDPGDRADPGARGGRPARPYRGVVVRRGPPAQHAYRGGARHQGERPGEQGGRQARGERAAEQRRAGPRRGEQQARTPADVAVAGVGGQGRRGGEDDDDEARGGGGDRGEAERVDQGGDGQDAAAAPERAQRDTDEGARGQGE